MTKKEHKAYVTGHVKVKCIAANQPGLLRVVRVHSRERDEETPCSCLPEHKLLCVLRYYTAQVVLAMVAASQGLY